MEELGGPVFSVGVPYYVVATFIQIGLPPIYRDSDDNDDQWNVLRAFGRFGLLSAVLLGSMLLPAQVGSDLPKLIGGILCILLGVRARQEIKRSVGAPMPWLTTHWRLGPFATRWPMAPFDILTLPIPILMAARHLTQALP